MGNLQAPIIDVQVLNDYSKAGFGEHKILLIAQGSGTGVAKTLLKNVQENEAETLLGAGSMATMAFNRIRKFNKATNVDVIPLAEPTGALKAQGGFKITGTSAEAKNLNIKVGDDEFLVTVVIPNASTATQIALLVRDAINAKSYPFTATIDGTDNTLVLISFNVGGDFANGLTTVAKDRVLGLEFSSVAFTGGAGAYDSTAILTPLTDRYQTVIFDTATNFDMLETWLQSRINVSNTVKGGHGISMMQGTLTQIKDYCNTKNSQTMTILGNVDTMKFNAISLLASAEFGAIRALRLTSGAIIGKYVLDAIEAVGGVRKASLPYHNTPISYDRPPAELTIEQVQELNKAGATLFIPSDVGTVMGTVTTLYKKDGSGVDDNTFKYLNAMDTSLAIQEYFYVNSQKRFGQTRATQGELVEGVSMTNTLSVKAFIVGLYEDLVNMSLAQGGSDAIKAFKKNLTVALDTATGKYSVVAPTPIVSQFRAMSMIVPISYEIKN